MCVAVFAENFQLYEYISHKFMSFVLIQAEVTAKERDTLVVSVSISQVYVITF